MIVNHFEDELTGFGKGVVFQTVQGRAPNQRLGMLTQGSNEIFEPCQSRQAVIVGEGDELAACLGDTPIARTCGTGVSLVGGVLRSNFSAQCAGSSASGGSLPSSTTITSKLPCGKSLFGQGVEARFHSPWAIAGGDDDAGQFVVHQARQAWQ